MSGDKLNDLPNDFVKQFKPKEHNIIVEAVLQTDFRTHGIQAPRPFQLECDILYHFDRRFSRVSQTVMN